MAIEFKGEIDVPVRGVAMGFEEVTNTYYYGGTGGRGYSISWSIKRYNPDTFGWGVTPVPFYFDEIFDDYNSGNYVNDTYYYYRFKKSKIAVRVKYNYQRGYMYYSIDFGELTDDLNWLETKSGQTSTTMLSNNQLVFKIFFVMCNGSVFNALDDHLLRYGASLNELTYATGGQNANNSWYGIAPTVEESVRLWNTLPPPYNPTPIPPNDETDGNEGDYNDDSDIIDFPDLPTIPSINNGFTHAYQMTSSDLRTLASYLWSSDFFDNFIKLFNDPMEAINSLYYVRYPLAVGQTSVITVGNVVTPANGIQITNDFVVVDCGTVSLNEYFGNALDYDSKLSIYIPYVGVRQLDTSICMGGNINVRYHIQVTTGVALCIIYVAKTQKGTTLQAPVYTFECNCNCQIPLSAKDNTSIYTSLLGVASSVGQFASGNLLGGALNLASNVMSSKSSVQKSGSPNGISGVLGVQKPFIIIERPINAYPENYNDYNGLPSYQTKSISELSGFCKFEQVELDGLTCTEEEKQELENLLKGGIYI